MVLRIKNYTVHELLYVNEFVVKEKEIIAVTGDSGSGKSTLFKSITGFFRDYEGELLFYDQSLRTLNPVDLRRKFCYVPQESVVYCGSLIENLKFGKELRGESFDYSEILEMSEFFLPGKKMDSNPSNFSSGEKQRLHLLRSLIVNAEIWLFDEPTSNLDQARAQDILAYILSYLKKKGKTVMFITHDPKMALLADRTIMIKERKLINV
ncbi:MAG: ABC transporter ATP-binding protein [Candidatus Delongbacteria bacterium]|nr:ABC transporter ATP-binding protein [Candidatus Delongbacteria bacterium]MBN2835933.1 ABC transporter ATP-binding protein [Candidatus Delongbacteria bacterium]